MENKTIDIENYFTTENEKKGVWEEPVIDGKPCGLEFLMIGIHNEDIYKQMDDFDKQGEEIRKENISDDEKYEKLEKLDARRVAVLTKGIRAKSGSILVRDGKEIQFSLEFAEEFYLNCPEIKMYNIEFALKSSNFMIIE